MCEIIDIDIFVKFELSAPSFEKQWSEAPLKYNYTASQKHESNLLHTYVLNEFLTADRSCKTNYFWKNSYRIL